ncbi:S46 family peptidase [Marinilabilia sp.]|uniref:S46 family peptidase n=1 Tax=Marinilabilia sp. TaxID=2021252 RepID=UPI0025B8CBAD|nr:S46 family peptidase [Marinilabilia sp.]
MKKLLLVIISLHLAFASLAKEGMWIPLLLEKYNIEEMQEMGFKLTAEDIYSINQASMKDAVMIFNGGCTAELISDQGLIITNHHCGYSAIQSHSTVENDYLTDGFWAMSKEEELANPNMSVTFLKYMEDVTDSVLKGVEETMAMKEREEIIAGNIKKINDQATKDTHYTATVKPFFHGNQYFLFVNEVFKDIRLVGAPPSAIGKFGGDTDNWMWPRHTGDFSVFRIYADENNEPTEFSAGNKPYKPAKHFPVSLKGIEEGDFTMVFGYPGSTYQYVPSFHLEMLTEKVYPGLIDIRTHKLNIMDKYMEQDRGVRIKYAAKNAGVSNSWKRWRGEIRGLDILDAQQKKKDYQADFQEWVAEDADREARYGNLLDEYEELYATLGDVRLGRDMLLEVIFRNGIEVTNVASMFRPLINIYEKEEEPKAEEIKKIKVNIKKDLANFFKDYHQPIDKEITADILSLYKENVNDEYLPAVYEKIARKYNGDFKAYADRLFKKTMFTDEASALNFLEDFSGRSVKKLKKDPAWELFENFIDVYSDQLYPLYQSFNQKTDSLNQIYMKAQMEFESDKVLYPDANFTLRVGYGKVKGYEPRDAVKYLYQTTIEGIMEKDNPDIYDYRVPERLKELYRTKNYGRYEEKGTVPVCFIATNHTTGGNSGSPVVNAEGHLIGVNFDRAWEGVMSDLMFNPEQCRNISLDIRYALFIIDKFAGAGYLLDEMTIIE